MAALTATADPNTGTVLIDVEQTIAYDLYGRTVAAGGWGSPDFGPAYTAQAPTAQFSVSGGLGRIAVNAVEDTFEVHLDTGQLDHENMIQLATNTAPTGAPVRQGSVVRFLDGNNYFRVSALSAVGGAVSLEMAARSGGTVYTLSTTVTDLNSASGMFLRTRACGDTFYAKIWFSSTDEPTAWTATATFPGMTGTRAGAFARRDTGNLTPTTFLFDDSWYGTADGVNDGSPPLRLFRVTPDGTRTEVRGSPFHTFPGTASGLTAIATFWDNEAPLDTQLTYEMMSACTDTAVLTSNAVTLLSNGNGWIRDPANPSNNILLTEDGPAYNECTTTREITFLSWGPRGFANSSGIFDIINTERPNTVSMRRKRYESEFQFATKTLDDMDLMESVFMPGTILLVSLPALYGFGRPYNSDYITVMDLEQEQVNTNDYRSPHRQWTVPFRLSYEPPDLNEGLVGGNGIGGGGATFEALAESTLGTTFATLAASGQTYQQVAQGVGY